MNVEIMINEIGGEEEFLMIKNVKDRNDHVEIGFSGTDGNMHYIIVNIAELKHALRKITV